MVTYYELGKTKQLNQIVIAGTHDAGITGGGKGVQTQSLDILGQALAGVRFFDIRIAAAVTSQTHASGKPVAELRAFHADDKVVFKFGREVNLKGAGQAPVNITQSKLAAGAFGEGLTGMLQQARNFVHSSTGKTEFLILKFDKCTNWGHIADACVDVLGMALYKGGGNINTKTLEDLKGQVVVLFSPKGLGELGAARPGILGFKNLSGDGQGYTEPFDGLQYYGKGGTSPFKPFSKLKQNIKKQSKLMTGAGETGNPKVIGMMYWTTTGLIESIKKRDDGMWDTPNIGRMKALWGQGLGDYVNGRMPFQANNAMANGQLRRKYFPNIVMIDFADDRKCQKIREQNDLAAQHLVDVE